MIAYVWWGVIAPGKARGSPILRRRPTTNNVVNHGEDSVLSFTPEEWESALHLPRRLLSRTCFFRLFSFFSSPTWNGSARPEAKLSDLLEPLTISSYLYRFYKVAEEAVESFLGPLTQEEKSSISLFCTKHARFVGPKFGNNGIISCFRV